MKTFYQLQQLVENKTNDTSQSSWIQTLLNDYHKEVINLADWSTNEESVDLTTVAEQRAYLLPKDFDNAISVKFTVGTTYYNPKPIEDRNSWERLQTITESFSDTPIYYFIDYSGRNKKIELYPTPSSVSNTITVRYTKFAGDLLSTDFVDKTTGTVSITNGAKTVAGSGTAFAATDVGRYIRFDSDKFWYKIASYTSTTAITIEDNFEGTTISGGTFLIGTLPMLPETAQELLAIKVLRDMWEKREDFSPSGGKANYYKIEFDERLKEERKKDDRRTTNPSLTPLRSSDIINPNDFPQDLTK